MTFRRGTTHVWMWLSIVTAIAFQYISRSDASMHRSRGAVPSRLMLDKSHDRRGGGTIKVHSPNRQSSRLDAKRPRPIDANQLDKRRRASMLPLFQERDLQVLRDVLDCSGSCSYVGFHSAEKYDNGSFESRKPAPAIDGSLTTSGGLSVSVRKFSRIMHCPTTWLRLLSSCPSTDWPPPRDVPEALRDDFTMGGRAAVSDLYFSQRYSGGIAQLLPHWVASDLNQRIAADSLEDAVKDIFSYSIREARYLEHAIARHARASIRNRVGVVWGSELPWVEVLLARHGAKKVITVEYGRIKVDEHAVISATTPDKLAAMMLTHPRSFDFAVTFSSLEHSGLGRYGDSLNAYGDIEAAVQTWCLLRPGGIFLLGLPSRDSSASEDELVWNAHRFYGPLRLAEMFAGYEHVETIDSRDFGPELHFSSIIHVIRKPWTTL